MLREGLSRFRVYYVIKSASGEICVSPRPREGWTTLEQAEGEDILDAWTRCKAAQVELETLEVGP